MKQNLKEIAYKKIKENILECVYEPNSILNEERLQTELGISRTPIREALSCIEHEGLIKIIPKKGILVSNFTISDLYHIYEIRMLHEPYLIRTYAGNIEKEILVEMRELHVTLLEQVQHGYTPEMQKELYKLDDSFHAIFYSVCPNPYMKSIYELVKSLSQRQRIMIGKIFDTRVISTIEEHIEIIDLILNKDLEEAASSMIKHMSKSLKASIKTITDNPLSTRF